jgi:hypothetical protein
MNTPILFIIFNRIETTQKVFDAIREAKPRQLFVAADGPRVGKRGEKEKCEETRNIINQVDWDCEVKTLFRDENLGCKKGPVTAITWFFENVEEGIILEDDCLPDLSFFRYCEYLLDKYRYNEKVFMISGDNFLPESLRLKESYYFTNFPHIWGWASWRRAWSNYDIEMKELSSFISQNKINNFIENKYSQNYFLERFHDVKSELLVDAWDYQWVYTIWNNNGYSIAPNHNLISNIGFGQGGTNTLNENDIFANLKTEELEFPLVDNDSVSIYKTGDDYESKFYIDKKYKMKRFLRRVGLFNLAKKVYFYFKK